MNHYAAPSQNFPDEQGPARSSSEFMKHPGYVIELSALQPVSIGGIEAGLRRLSSLWLAAGLIRWARGKPPVQAAGRAKEDTMSVGMIDTSRIEAMVAQLKAAAARTSPASVNPSENPLQAKQAGGVDFQSALKSSLDQVNQTQLQSQKLAERFAMGDSSVSLSDAMIAMQKSSIALQQTVQVRNKLVSAYNDIMNMPV
jgi:flagellar hook-basal body complex protein FliE